MATASEIAAKEDRARYERELDATGNRINSGESASSAIGYDAATDQYYTKGSITDIYNKPTTPTSGIGTDSAQTLPGDQNVTPSLDKTNPDPNKPATIAPLSVTNPVTPTTPASTGMTQEEYRNAMIEYQNRVDESAKAARQLALDQAWQSNQQALNSQNATVANNYQSAVNALNAARAEQLPKYQTQRDATSSEAAATQRRTEALNAMGGITNSGANRSQVQDIDLARQAALQGIQGDQNVFETSITNKLSEADASRVAALNDVAEKIALGQQQHAAGTLNLSNQLTSDKAAAASKAYLDAQTWADQKAQQELTNKYTLAELLGTVDGQQTVASKQAEAGIANTNANTAYQNLVNSGYPQEQALRMATAQSSLTGQNLTNDYQSLVNAGYPAEQAANLAQKAATLAGTQAATTYQNLVNSGYGAEQSIKMAQAQATLTGTNYANDYQALVNAGYPEVQAAELAQKAATLKGTSASTESTIANTEYQKLVTAGYATEQATKMAQAAATLKGTNLANDYQALVNAGYPEAQAASIAATNRSGLTSSSTTKAPTAAEIAAAKDSEIGRLTSVIYDKIYGQNDSNESALSALTSSKGSILSDLAAAGMSAKEALEYYTQMYDDLGGK